MHLFRGIKELNYRIYSNKRRPRLSAAHGVENVVSAALK